MLCQISLRAGLIAATVFLLVTAGLTCLRLNIQHARALLYVPMAHAFLFFDDSASMKVTNPHTNRKIVVKASSVPKSNWVKRQLKQVDDVVILSMFYGKCAGIAALLLIFVYLARRGKQHSATKKLRGYDIASKKHTKQLVRKKNASDIKIATLSMPKDFETGHILIHGTTGMGKSVCIKELLDQIRARGDRAIIYDQGCDYIGSFYNEDDVILNPLDDRTASWNLWNECRDSADYDSLAAALIPAPANASEPFWTNGARVIFAAIARKLETTNNKSISLLLESILNAELNELEGMLRGTEAASLVSERIEKTALSFKSMLATYLKSLKYVKDTEKPFSIRNWIQDDSNSNWLFISSLADRHETLKPLISMWLDLAANALMSLTPSYTRRIWLIFDELASLHKLPYLPNAFAQSRKFGGCMVASMQSISQLRKVYGQHAADEISTMCNTRIFFRSPSNEAAVWTSKELGQHEVEEMKEGISYSESAMRSGISINKQRIQKDLVSPAEIMRLHTLEAYIRLPGELPITKIKIKYKDRSCSAEPFVIRKIIEKDFVVDKDPIAKQTKNDENNSEDTENSGSIENNCNDDKALDDNKTEPQAGTIELT